MFVIAGTEDEYYAGSRRAHGVQSFYLGRLVQGITKPYGYNAPDVAWDAMFRRRPGPVVLEVPIGKQ